MFTDIWICREKRYRRRYGQCNIKVLENMCFLIVHKKIKSPETVLSPFTGTQTVTPCEGADFSAPAFFLLSYAGNEMTSLSGGSSFGCFSSGCMALSTVPMSR